MELALEIIKREIAQRELANKHDHLRKDICTKELQELNDVVNLLSIPIVSKSFNSEKQLLQYIRRNIPIAVKPTSKNAKSKLVNPFTSINAFEEVCKHLAYKLFNVC